LSYRKRGGKGAVTREKKEEEEEEEEKLQRCHVDRRTYDRISPAGGTRLLRLPLIMALDLLVCIVHGHDA
jgi:hypothetical protein